MISKTQTPPFSSCNSGSTTGQEVKSASSEHGRQSTSASTKTDPCPQLYHWDTRFHPKVRERKIYCDACWNVFSFQPTGFDGQYVYHYWPAEEEETNTAKLAHKEKAYWEGKWNATWLCSKCWLSTRNADWDSDYSLDDIRSYLGVDISQAKEFERKRRRTQGGSRRA